MKLKCRHVSWEMFLEVLEIPAKVGAEVLCKAEPLCWETLFWP